jgi:hypothetical protein
MTIPTGPARKSSDRITATSATSATKTATSSAERRLF